MSSAPTAAQPRLAPDYGTSSAHAERREEANGGCHVVDDDADVVHSPDCHVASITPDIGQGTVE
jgi:hypothetical protein